MERTPTSSCALKADHDFSGIIRHSTSVLSYEPAETTTDFTEDEKTEAAPIPMLSGRCLIGDEETDFMKSEDEEMVFKKIVLT